MNSKFRDHAFALAIISFSILFLSSCGTPSKLYASDQKDGVYFSAPRSWLSITKNTLDSVEAKSKAAGAADRLASVHWQIAFSPDRNLKAAQVLSIKAPSQPVVYVRVRSLSYDEANSVSYNTLRDLVVPLTTWASGSDSTAPSLSVISDSEMVQRGGRGIHTRFTFTNSTGEDQTIDQSALISDDRSTLYLMIARCTSECFSKHEGEISQIVKSFTVRGHN